MAMKTDETTFPGWLPTLVVLAVAIAFLVADPAGLASRFAAPEFGILRALHTTGTPLRIVDSIPAQIVLLETVGAALVLLVAAREFSWAVGVALVAVLAAQLSSLLICAHLGALFDTANASAAILLAAVVGLFARPFGKSGPRALALAARRVPQAPTAKAESAPAQAGEVLVLTSLSCGLRRASALARFFDNDAPGFMRLAESVMAPLMDDAAAHGAWISRFDGISFSAEWPAADDGANAGQACDAVGRMIAGLAKANERLEGQWPQGETECPVLEIGIGLTTGNHLAGPVRAQGRTEACLVAEDAATAQRLRDLSERYGSAAIVSEATCVAAQRAYAFLEIDFLVLDPGAPPVRLYALLGNPLMRASPKFRAVATFHEHIFQSMRARQWEKARGLIAQCRKISGASQKLYELHLARIAYGANPPPPDWDGAFRPPLQ
jgi:adenylate cyclase